MELTNDERLKFAAWLEAERDELSRRADRAKQDGFRDLSRTYHSAVEVLTICVLPKLRVHDLHSAAALLDQDD